MGLAVLAAILAPTPAYAVDTSSIGGFVSSCRDDQKGCHALVLNAVLSARNAKYGCIPADLDNDSAADKVLGWLKATAANDAKYAKDALPDLMWTGIDETWPCKK
jgi:hypothetical protein